MKTPEELVDELTFVIANSSADAYVTKTDEHGIRRTEFDVGIIAQAVINHLAADMNEVREALEAGKKCVNKCFVGLSDTRGISYNRNDVPKIIDKALAKLECWRKP
jgi:spore germination protein YaaH